MFSEAKKGHSPLAGTVPDLVAFVAQSPRLCAAHDRSGWCSLFATDGQINDPIGSQPHDGRVAIENFYDTFIAPNALSFDVEKDTVCGMTVVRDLHINTVMSTGVRIAVPMHIRYVLKDEGGQLRIHRLYAHWELTEMLKQQFRTLRGWWTSLLLTPRLLKYQGLSGLLGFMRGLFGNGRAGKKTVDAFLAAARDGDVDAARVLLAAGRELPELRGIAWRKLLAAGDWVSTTIELGGQRGVAVFRFDESPRTISEVLLYL